MAAPIQCIRRHLSTGTTRDKIKVSGTVVELKGDEMAAVMWEWIKDKLILPHVDVNREVYDLSVQTRHATNDKITVDASQAILKHNVGIKCATITIDDARMKEFNLPKKYPSPNATIRKTLDGTIFRTPIVCRNVPTLVSGWKMPITIARHGFGDIYDATEMAVENGEMFLKYMPVNPSNQRLEPSQEKSIFEFKEPHSKGVVMACYNTDKSIIDFANCCFTYAYDHGLNMFFSSKNTILSTYDGRFQRIFQEIYKKEFIEKFQAKGITYEHRLIDDMVAYALKSSGGYLWACKNYDGDVVSDIVAQGFGSLGMMTSILVAPDGRTIESEAAHGTVTRHFRQHMEGKATSTNPIASIFAWTRGLMHRAKLDQNKDLLTFCQKLESTCINVVESGLYTKDIALAISKSEKDAKYLTTEEFIDYVATKL